MGAASRGLVVLLLSLPPGGVDDVTFPVEEDFPAVFCVGCDFGAIFWVPPPFESADEDAAIGGVGAFPDVDCLPKSREFKYMLELWWK